MNPYETGYCWNCGRRCAGLFCNPGCEKRYDKKQRDGSFGRGGHAVRRGKKDGYGLAGSTH
jgi:hypothetical protein